MLSRAFGSLAFVDILCVLGILALFPFVPFISSL